MKCWTGSNSGRIWPVTLELHALERWKKNDVSCFSQLPLMRYLSNLQVTRTGIKAWNELEFRPNRIIHFGVIHPWSLNFFPIYMYLYWRKWCIHLFSVTLNSIAVKLIQCNEDMHKFLDKFELRPDLINRFGVMCPWVVEKKYVHFQSDLLQTCLQLEQA